MGCDVYVYDDTMSPIASGSIEIIETDHWGTKIDIQMSTMLGPTEYGARLKSPTPAEPVNIWLDDTHHRFAPTSLGHLNGKLHARLDVTLYPLPRPVGGYGGGGGGGLSSRTYRSYGGGPATPNKIAAFIEDRVAAGEWTASEGRGVGSLVETAIRALNTTRRGKELQSRLDDWCERLSGFGIEISTADVGRGSFQGGTMESGGGLQAEAF